MVISVMVISSSLPVADTTATVCHSEADRLQVHHIW